MNLNSTLFSQLIVFIILTLFIKKFIWPKFIKVIDERSKNIENSILNIKKSKNKLKKIEEEIKKKISKIDLYEKTKISESKKLATLSAQKIKKKANQEAKKIINNAKIISKQKIEYEKKIFKNKISELIILGIKKILKKEINIQDHKEVLHKLILKL